MPYTPQTAPVQTPRAQTAAPALASVPPKPKVRLQMGDDPKVSEPRRPTESMAIVMPSPEQLGVGARMAEKDLDWNVLHRRFRDAGATCFQIDQRPDGGYKLTCLLPTGQPDRTRHIEVEAGSEMEVTRLALERLEEWKKK